MSVKPHATYEDTAFEVVVGLGVNLLGVDHPLKGRHEVTSTSRVLSYNEKTGRIETLNTIYIKV